METNFARVVKGAVTILCLSGVFAVNIYTVSTTISQERQLLAMTLEGNCAPRGMCSDTSGGGGSRPLDASGNTPSGWPSGTFGDNPWEQGRDAGVPVSGNCISGVNCPVDNLPPTFSVSPSPRPSGNQGGSGSGSAAGDSSSAIYFGGRVQDTFYCDCSYNTLVYVGPPRGGVFIQDYFTRVYGKYNVSVGYWVLGVANKTDSGCYVIVGDYCELYDSAPPMKMVGTS